MEDNFDKLDWAPTIPGGPGGQILSGRYKIIRQIGSGGMGTVYLARDIELDIDVAVKVLPAILANNKIAIDNLRKEAKTALKLSHPNIVRLHTFQSNEEIKYLVMEYVNGGNLEEKISAADALSVDETYKIFSQIADGLDYAHSQNVLHRDIKPANIMLTKGGVAKLADFGIAREIHDSYTRVTGKQETAGTLLYMAPEQFRGGEPDIRSDIYSLAASIYECLSGKPPFWRGSIEYQIMNVQPVSLEKISGEQNAALLKALSKDPNERQNSANELMNDFGKDAKKSIGVLAAAIIAVVVIISLSFAAYHWLETERAATNIVQVPIPEKSVTEPQSPAQPIMPKPQKQVEIEPNIQKAEDIKKSDEPEQKKVVKEIPETSLIKESPDTEKAKEEKKAAADTKKEVFFGLAKKKEKIRLNFLPGQETGYKVITEAAKDYKFVQPSINKSKERHTIWRAEIVYTQKNENIDSWGNVTADISIRKLSVLQDPESKKLDFDSTSESGKKDQLFALIGQSYKIKITPEGKVDVVDARAAREAVQGENEARKIAERLLSDDEIIKRHQVPALNDAPKNAAKKGDKWNSLSPSPEGMLKPKTFEKDYTLSDITKKNGSDIATVTMNAFPSSKHIPETSENVSTTGFFANMFDEKDTYTGKLILDLSTGEIESYQELLKAEWVAVETDEKGGKIPDQLTMGFSNLYSIEKVNGEY